MRAPALAGSTAIFLVLSACGTADEAAPPGEEAPKGIYTVDGETGETRASVTNEDGTTTMRAGAGVRVQLPPGFTVYPGAEVRHMAEIGRGTGADGGRAIVLSFASDDPPADLIAHYRGQAEAAGIAVDVELGTDALSMIGGQAADGTRFTFQTGRPDGQTTGETNGETIGETTGQLTVGRGLD